MGEICSRQGRWIGGCKFEARYDLGPADLSRFESLSGGRVVSFMETLRSKTYRGDVCVRCGKIVNEGK
jgi:hypothetical protein